jgi:hypothetical protein
MTKPKEPSEIEYEASSVASAIDERASDEDTDHFHEALIGENVEIGQLPRHAGELKPSSRERWEPGGCHRRTVSLALIDILRPRSSSFTDKKMSLSHSTSTLHSIGIWITVIMGSTGTDAMLQERPEDDSAFSRSNYIDIPNTLSDFMDNYPVNPGLEEGDPFLFPGESNETRSILSDYL